jgi:hypothetical protein
MVGLSIRNGVEWIPSGEEAWNALVAMVAGVSQALRFGDVPAADAGMDARKKARNGWVAKGTAKATSVVMKGV